ncbi:PBECR4 domain-containing protein [uncultured Streptococcus sp.]|uniref:PBECR4 domain-containing protein n=1 Tax=uncultured Streptococcus sp. TaxID=83427 RepID=UPI002592D477|nr:PBECR4 domain-containing protein [uncultured Streptococcus sp.]
MANMQELLSQRFEAQKQKLVSMDIVAVAESLGMTLKPGSSGTYYWEEHDSFHIYPNTNTFRWWSRGVGTNTIDLVQVVQEEMTGHKPTFREATSFLETGQFNNVTIQPPVKEPFEYYLERYEHPDFNIGRQYLKEERGLSNETIDTFLASGNLATATRKKGDYFEPIIVFKSRDNDGKMIGASLQGIVENRVQHPERGRLKQIMKNSEGTAGFSLDIGTPKRLVFAEAPIDLMSYYEVNKDDLQDVKLVAMDGLKKGVVSRYVADLLTDGKYSQTMSAEQIRGALDALNQTTNLLQEHPDMITLAVDNDEAGRRFVSDLQENGIPVVADLPPRQANQEKMDWNDYLKQMKKESTQMVENQEKTGGILPKKNIDGVEQKSLESFSDTQKEAVGELKSYGTFIIDDDFFERRYSSVEHDTKEAPKDNKKSLEQLQETVASNSEQQKKVENPIGDLPEQSQEAAPLPSTHEEHSLNESSPTQTQSQPLLHFTISDPEKSIYKLGYHPVNEKELNKLNRYATQIQENATWYKNELADSNVTYFYKNNDNLEALKVTFKAEQYSHLVGIFAIDDDQSASKTLDDLASGKGDYQNIMVANRGATFSKIQVLPDFKAVIDSNSFIFDDLSEVERMNRLDLAKAIQTEDKDVLIAFRNVDGEYLPASLMKVTNKLESELSMANNKDVLGIIGEKDGEFKVLSVNEEAIKDGGEKMLSIVKNNQFENLSKAEVTAEDFTKVLDAVYNVGAQVGKDNRANIPEELYPAWDKYYEYAERYDNNFDVIVKAARADNLFDENSDFYKDVWLRKIQEENQKVKDSDGDGLTDDEEIALGTNPYSPDTDGDGILDSVEKASGTDATNPSDTSDSRKEEMSKRDLTLSEMIKAKNTESLNQHLQEGIKDYFDSDNYKNFLEGMSHFNNYSVRNIQLIKAQFPEASMVASFNEWKKRNGHVNKGEKALYVQAPVTVIKKDADGNPVINSETGEKETIAYFKPVPVFDVSQVSPVEGKELNLPKMGGGIPEQITKDYYQNVYRSLRDISQKENGIPIRFRELEKSDGFYNPKTNEITIKKGMTYEQTLSTLIHGMAHSELHNKKSLTERFEGKLTCSSKEIQAESVAYVVSNHLGFDTSDDSFAYLASWSQEPDGLENLKAQLEIVQEEASSLMKRIDKHLEKYQNLTVSKDETLTANQKRELSKATNPFYQSLQKAKEESKQVTPANEEQTKKVNRPTKQ